MEYVVLNKGRYCYQCGKPLAPAEVVAVEDDRAFCLTTPCIDVYRREQEKGAKR